MSEVGVAIAVVVSVVSLIGTITTVVRLFTKTEVKAENTERMGGETARLARETADKLKDLDALRERVNGLDERLTKTTRTADDTADRFVREGETAHIALMSRVATLERDMVKLATIESVQAVRTEVKMGFDEVKAMLARIERDMENRS